MIRRATPADEATISRVHAEARDEMTYVPRIPDDVRWTLGRRIMEWSEVWIADAEEGGCGFIGLQEDLVTHLYVERSAQNRGIGTALLDHAKSLRPTGSSSGCSRRTRARAGSTSATASASSGSRTAPTTWRRSRTRSTNGGPSPGRAVTA